ncbi:heptaprenyl diphosphate synthase component 1 [Bacillus sp. FJAT-49705]|uniref:Heptaprenyl diphosphate synthase component 1 n=1 Tax=Cytobacillus citreus TaxID=2833586 RepID=A0ABS5NUC5_9BACI|nr:heptaprenyl diphosphate synthase component 1 [Cytobacillus citreus]MBS4191039.1 heptaprenyl diphosphate synthase component 1 [Cytobacillus citreus]
MQDIKVKLADVKEQIEEKIRHPYLLKYIKSPIIDEDKLLLLISILEQVNLPEKKTMNYAITTMLIQIALDTHELVSNQKSDPNQFKHRQLTVLAGVYYSGLYYKILAELDDVNMIRSLATGIKEVNEQKISVYQKESENIDELMDSIKKIEYSLFDKLCTYLDDPNYCEFVSNLLLMKRLIAEKTLFLQGVSPVIFESLKKLLLTDQMHTELSSEQKQLLVHTCDRYIDSSYENIQTCISNLPNMNDMLIQRVQTIINQHQPAENIFVEEGY